MAFLKLKDIGKIYVNEGSINVGIRGVNLEFNLGEFVAITGESGSGKSTLLNVISGIDTYEEGEMLIENNVTSHYDQSDFEEYRNKYISFIFQDYNIIDSFTVLENVELALMGIDNSKERKNKALELIDRVGLLPWANHKGSKLSGGQKQRTVIARALAKDSPIILADEPTGNLDASTSKEIIKLLKEVSKDKLLIIVTHDFDDVKDYASRHIRFFDGSIYSDTVLQKTQQSFFNLKNTPKKLSKNNIKCDIKNGITLGKSIFKSKPILSAFTVFLLIMSSLFMLLVTSFCYKPFITFKESQKMFTYHEGRLIYMNRDSKALDEEAISQTAAEFGAFDYVYFDKLLDSSTELYFDEIQKTIKFEYAYYKEKYEPDLGEYPKEKDEVMLYLPIGFKEYYGDKELKITNFEVNGFSFKITGIDYYYDNRQSAKIISSQDGFKLLGELDTLNYQAISANLQVLQVDMIENVNFPVVLDLSLPKNTVVIPIQAQNENIDITFEKQYDDSGFYMGYYNGYSSVCVGIPKEYVKKDYTDVIKISYDIYSGIIDNYFKSSYNQATLFFKNDAEAKAAMEEMNNGDYISVLSSTEFEPDIYTVITTTIVAAFMGIIWFLMILFLSFFISLCLTRTISSTKTDIGIMRSMGIPVKIIKLGLLVKMIISMLISFAIVIFVGFLVFTSPKLNMHFTFLSPVQYLLVFLGVALIDVKVTKSQIKKLFKISVKNSIKGGKDQ